MMAHKMSDTSSIDTLHRPDSLDSIVLTVCTATDAMLGRVPLAEPYPFSLQ